MKDAETDWQEGKTLLTTAAQEGTASSAPVPALTILAHSNAERVGEHLAESAWLQGLKRQISALGIERP